jgi:hypothetical protein
VVGQVFGAIAPNAIPMAETLWPRQTVDWISLLRHPHINSGIADRLKLSCFQRHFCRTSALKKNYATYAYQMTQFSLSASHWGYCNR